MSSKRPLVDLAALTAEAAVPMAEAQQRAPQIAPANTDAPPPVRAQNLEALAFKVSPAFRKRFRKRAVEADLKLNELLFEALDAWEQHKGLKR
jgi:hypothetical protein